MEDIKKVNQENQEEQSQPVETGFFDACRESGVLINLEEEQPEGIGAVYTPRLKAPTTTDKNWIHYSAGGYNYCILIANGSCLPNCVGYCWGRWRELLGKYPELSKGNAERWYGYQDGYKRGQTPKLGAVAVWKQGEIGDSTPGHVAIVEKIDKDGTVTCSNSDYGGQRFYLTKMKKPFNIGSSFQFLGFIYPPTDYTEKEKLSMDGEFGVKSIKAMERWLKVKETGVISNQRGKYHRYVPNIVSITISPTGTSETAKALQKKLTTLGYKTGSDGQIGTGTVKNLQRFLKSKGYTITPDGVFGANTAKKMQQFLNTI